MTNQLYYGDNLEIMQKYIEDESIDLCYIDPPFNSKRNYNQIYNNIGKEDTAQAQAFLDTWTWNRIAVQAYEEIIENKNKTYTLQSISLVIGLAQVLGKGSLMAYLVSMTQCIAQIHRVLKPTGSFYLHCDPTASHYLKLVCDAIFNPQGGEFRNEIIWSYRRWTNASKDFQRMHDVIFRYSKGKNFTFNIEYEKTEHIEKVYDKGWDRNVAKGKRQLIVYDKEKAQTEIEKENYDKLVFRENMQGVSLSDVFNINYLSSKAKERLGYPTQKPEALMERIIQASSNEGDVVLDAYCGCGTTIAVAERLSRKWIGVDITYQSISLILKRLEDTFGSEFVNDVVDKTTKKIVTPARLVLSGVPLDFESAVALAHKQDDRVRKEFEKWAVLTYSNNRAMINDKKGGDGGIDGTAFIVDFDDKDQQIFRQAIFSVKSGKVLPPSVVRDLFGTVEREKAAVGFLITLYPMPNLVKEAERYGNYTSKMFGQVHQKIQVIDIQQIIDGDRMALPTTAAVVKSAERNVKNNQSKLDL
jgi:DNA modification methylase